MVSISPLSDGVGDGTAPVEFPSPFQFRAPEGEITEVRIGAEQVVHGRISHDMSLAKIAGLRYEQQFLDYLRNSYPQCFIRPHIHFRDNGRFRTVIPDALLIGFARMLNNVVIVEVKSQHMPEAWWQLTKLYKPVIEAGFPNLNVCCVEVCRTYDPQLKWPVDHVLYDTLQSVIESPAKLGVLKWRRPTSIQR